MSEVIEKATQAKTAAFRLRKLSAAQKTEMLRAMAQGLEQSAATIIAANEKDCARGLAAKMSVSLIDRLRLDQKRIIAMAEGLRAVAD
jgi:glutamate-5-semialdehyde dehydrogenase